MHRAAVAAFERVGNYWHLLPLHNQARKAIWEAVNPHTGRRRIDEAFPPEIRTNTRDQEMMIRFRSGSTWQVVGSDNYNSLVGASPLGIVFSEWALSDPDAWTYMRPILAENEGWALFIFTPRGRNHAAAFYDAAMRDPAWFAEKLDADRTDVFSPEVLRQEKAELIRQFDETEGTARFEQEYYCSFAAPMVGAYYGTAMNRAEAEGRIGKVPYEPALPVETWWDLGVGDSTAIWFAQRHHREVRLIDYHEASGEGLQYYARVLQERGYVYSRHLAPHDIEVRELSTGKSRRETARTLGIDFDVVPQASLEDGIEAVRDLLPRCWFDAEKCQRGVEALRQYRKAWDDKLKTFRSYPMHDWASHGADSFRYGASADDPVKVDIESIDPLGGRERAHRPYGYLGA